MLSLGSDDFTRFRGHEIEWPALNDFFLYPISDGDARANLGEAESRMTESVPGIKWDLGNPVWEPQGRLVRCPVQEDPELYEPDELPDVVLLSRHSFGANPELASAWASNPDDDEDSDDANRQDWEQVAAIGVLGGMKKNDNTSEWECVIPATRIKHHLLKLAAESPIRSHTFGFTLDGSILTLFLHNPSGLFYSPKIECTEANGHLSTFIARLLSLNDRDLGRVAFPGEPGGRPLPFATAALPPLVPCFACRLGDVPTMSSIEIVETILCSSEVVGLQKTTSRVRDDARGIGSTDDDEDKYAMTVSFCEGLTDFIDVHREVDFTFVPTFLQGVLNAEASGLKPKAMEVTFQERWFEPISVGTSRSSFERSRPDHGRIVIDQVAFLSPGLRSLYRMRILHRDISLGNIMIGPDGEGVLIDHDLAVFVDGPSDPLSNTPLGTFPFRARHLIKADGGTPHQPWHDIESPVYAILFIVFSQPKGPGDSHGMSEEAEPVWRHWNSDLWAYDSKEGLLQVQSERRELLEPFLEFWKKLDELIATVANHCGLGLSIFTYDEAAERKNLETTWGTGELSHHQLVTDLEDLLGKMVQKKRRGVKEEFVVG
ncbi:BQ2448_1960 [Microbotryum intermedium]|uniref:BQ2448_1960 protein n=1 Tax=Microbotryum intermedium TaxID=269621 RepID=A0A238F4Q1_9BASI|nr:BQ2448_1960 [Microbotryum intermedium]